MLYGDTYMFACMWSRSRTAFKSTVTDTSKKQYVI